MLQPILLDRTNLGVAELNQTLAVGSALFVVGMPAWLKIKRKIGSIKTLVIALQFFALSHLFVGVLIWAELANVVEIYASAILLASRVFYGIGASAIVPVVQAWASNRANSNERLELLQKISAFLTLGRIIGPVIALPLLWIWPPLTIFLVLCLAMYVSISLWKLRKDEDEKSEDVCSPGRQKIISVLGVKVLGPYLTLAASLQSLVGIVQFSFSIWLVGTFPWGAENVAIFTGCLLMISGMLVVIAQFYRQSLIQAFPSVLHVLVLLLLVLSLVLLVRPNIVCFSAFNMLVVVTAALWAPTYLHTAIEKASDIRKDSISTALAMTHTIAYSLAGMVSGYLYQWDVHSIFFLAAMLSIVAFHTGRPILANFIQSVNT